MGEVLSLESVYIKPRSADNASAGSDARQRQARRLPQRIVCQILAGTEVILLGAILVGLLARSRIFPGVPLPFAIDSGIGLAAIVLLCFSLTGAISFERFCSRLSLLPGALAGGCFAGFTILLAHGTIVYALFGVATFFVAVQVTRVPTAMLRNWLVRRGTLVRLVAVASNDPSLRANLIQVMQQREDIEIVHSGMPDEFETLSRLTQDGLLDEIVLAGHEALPENVSALAGLAVTLVRVTPQDRLQRVAFDTRWGQKRVFSAWNAPAAIIAHPPLKGWRGAIKRALDIAGSLTALVLLSPVMIACAIGIRLEGPGPIFFVQERAGYRNKPFRMFKFRSMRAATADATGSQLTLRNDPRVTKFGAFLRRSSADELPQLFNVLLGDMSLVGPRPHPKGAKAGAMLYDDLIPNFYARYRMKPGITGLAQISGFRGNTETEQHLIDRFDRDLQYAAEWSPILDIVILFRTVLHLFKGTNAF
jgi:exopolysaccharide biosynthesis polyprenyl glycosylphosphotransferase